MYFYDRVDPDVDNIVKPVQDALSGLVYKDDSQIVDSISRKRNLSGSYSIEGVTPILAEALQSGQEFVYVRVEAIEDIGELRL